MNYTGKLRIATGIALLNAFTETVDNAAFTKTRELGLPEQSHPKRKLMGDLWSSYTSASWRQWSNHFTQG
jgi:hypothetical protein